jgi:hypothetical protein
MALLKKQYIAATYFYIRVCRLITETPLFYLTLWPIFGHLKSYPTQLFLQQ